MAPSRVRDGGGSGPDEEVGGEVPAPSYTPALDVIAHYLRLVCIWPEGRGPVARVLGEYLPYSFIMTATPPLVYFALGEHTHTVELFGFLADSLGSTLCMVKMLTLQRHSGKIIAVRELIKGFGPLERSVAAGAGELNERCERRGGKLAKWYVRVYSSVTVTGIFSMTLAVIRNDPKSRWLPVKAPAFIMQSQPVYIVVAILTAVELYVFPVAIGIFDCLLITLCLHIACKCDVLVLMLRRAVSDEDAGVEAEDGDASRRRLRLCVVYHQRILRVHREVESILSTIALAQMFYAVFGLGTPLFRLMDKTQEIGLQDAVFSVTYVSWTFCQLFTFCFFGDAVAESSQRLSSASYASFHPTLTGRDAELGRIQHMLALRAQKPLYITAGRFTNLTLQLFQDIMSRSYSLYSTVLRMR